MRTALLTTAWLVGVIYASIPSFWLAVHPFTPYWRSRPGKIYPQLGLIWAGVMLLLAVVTFPMRSIRLYQDPRAWLAGAVFFILGLSIYRRVGRAVSGDIIIGRNQLQPEKHEQRLVATGMHATVRHPIYLAHWCMLTGWAVGSGLLALYLLWAFAVLTGTFMIRMEEHELEERFGESYREYKRRVPAILPSRAQTVGARA